MPGRFLLYTDGASRGNPGPAGIGAVLYRDTDRGLERVGEISRAIGVSTNNVAEYQALIAGLELALRHRPDELVVRVDSELLVRQLSGEYRVKAPHLKGYHRKVVELARKVGSVRFEHVPRSENAAADALANSALD